MDILRIATAGSVDDGKSTLIGRLLFETESITKDKIEALRTASQRKGLDFVDLSLLTDGLIAEREQGITIDVAHIYFNTPNRKYIIADTPGHFEYTRNMVTGASNASVSIILIDARNGVGEQTKRHFFISSLLQIKNIVVAVNKMDLVDYSEDRFEQIKADFKELVGTIANDDVNITFLPISSLYGENITRKSEKTAWYTGESLLDILENVAIVSKENANFRLPVQFVIRPKTDEYHDFRGYAGKIASGTVKVGDTLTSLPSMQSSTVTAVLKNNEDQGEASQGESVVITLKTDIDVSRGNMLVKQEVLPNMQKDLLAQVCWMENQPLVAGKTYLLQHGIHTVKAKISQIVTALDIKTLEDTLGATEIQINQIGKVSFKTSSPIFADSFNVNPNNGAFIFVDEFSKSTVGVGFVE
ncbi:MAG: sulfate adenylyltransferase subunit 1 [Leadbetterella sp.]